MDRTDRELVEDLARGYLETLSDEELEAAVGGNAGIRSSALGLAEGLT